MVATVSARMMSAPPMVGVPRLDACAAGPSSRMTSPSCRSRARRMNQGAIRKVMISEVSVARPTRVETYRKTFAPGTALAQRMKQVEQHG